MMFNAIRTLQTKPVPPSLFPSYNLARSLKPTGVRFQHAAVGPNQPENNMDKTQRSQETTKKEDVMSNSFGEGYATRSDEEGFGGIYGGKQSLTKDDEDKIVHGNSPEYDESQGSEVKEKERARNQTHASS